MNHPAVDSVKFITRWNTIRARRGYAILSIALVTTGLLIGLSRLSRPGVGQIEARPLDSPGTLVVASTTDSGPGTLRWALANSVVSDTILFDTAVFPLTSPVTISLSNALPAIITDGLTIDASNAGVVLNGSGLSNSEDGLIVNGASRVTICGLQILNFPEDGINIKGGAVGTRIGPGNLISGNGETGIRIDGSGTMSSTVVGNYIGTDASGTVSHANEYGVFIGYRAASNTVGGSAPEARNLISGNRTYGVLILGTGTSENRVLGNYIGTDLTGTSALPNGNYGVGIGFGAANNVIGENLISGNAWYGVAIDGNGTMSNTVVGNYIGTDFSGTVPLGNAEDGVVIVGEAIDNVIGGDAIKERNLISGNGESGVSIQGNGTMGNVVIGNYIGTDAAGVTALPNRGNGVDIGLQAASNVIGGDTSGLGNLISGNEGVGVKVSGISVRGNRVLGNYIGTNVSGTAAIPNGIGVLIDAQATDNKVGGETTGSGNLISGNKGVGIKIHKTGTMHNVVLGNLIRFNGGGGIAIEDAAQNTVTGNTIHNNEGLAAWLPVGNLLVDNDFSGNRYNYAQVTGGAMPTQDEIWSVQGDLDTYLVVKYDVTVSSDVTWTLAPGIHTQFDFGLGVVVSGTLIAESSDELPIRLTSAERYAFPLPGDWQGLTFNPGSSGSLRQASIEFAANGLTLRGGTVSVVSSTIAASQHDGILVQTGALTLEGNTLAGNGGLAINNQTGTPIDASGTWWGHASGPEGLGDLVSTDVNYENWRINPEPNDGWRQAMVLNPGSHSFPISSYRDLEWFRIPAGTRNATLTATLTDLPQDYDLLLFSQLGSGAGSADGTGRSMYTGSSMHIGRSMYTGDVDETGQVSDIGRSMYTGQLADVGQAFDTGNLLQVSTHPGRVGEQVATGIWNQSGWYHLLVAGHNGANDPAVSYTLQITVSPGVPLIDPSFEPPVFEQPEWVSPTVKTLILTHRGRMESRYGVDDIEDLMDDLDVLAAAPEVAGLVVSLDTYQPIAQTYDLWTENITNPVHANLTAATIKAMLAVTRTAYPNLENILIVGDDEIVPFRRTPDEAALANEESYVSYLLPETALAASFQERYLLSDDYYADFDPIPWRGRGLFLPDYAVGRLVERPKEMSSAIQAFLAQPVLTATTGLVVGYDFLTDQAEAIRDEMTAAGIIPDTLINDYWQAPDLRQAWLSTTHDLNSISAHFDHWRAIPPEPVGGVVTPTDVVNATAELSGTVHFSVGCHSGFSAPDEQVTAQGQDFPQSLLGRGAIWVGNTGFGYGDADAVGYSEQLMALFAQHLQAGDTVGQALRQAKVEYLNRTGLHSLSPYDEKVLAEATLYGLPMLRVQMPGGVAVTTARATSGSLSLTSGSLSGPIACSIDLTCTQAVFTPTYLTHTVATTEATGIYYSVPFDGTHGQQGEIEVNEGQPIQPRTSLSVVLTDTMARGAVFEGGRYQIFHNFDPVVTRVITEEIRRREEPSFDFKEWTPSTWELINSVRTPEGWQQQLVVIPAQYKATTDYEGVERRFEVMTYTVYYSMTKDTIPPSIWVVRQMVDTEMITVEVEVTDFSGVARVVAAYTTGDGVWRTVDLAQSPDPNTWVGLLPSRAGLEYLVQVVDGGGNVAISDNKGRYFGLPPCQMYLPLVVRNGSSR
jgi:parallel beta-helix repeat protein